MTQPDSVSSSSGGGSVDAGNFSTAVEPPDTVDAVTASLQPLSESSCTSRNDAIEKSSLLGSSYPPQINRSHLPDRLAQSNMALHGIPTSTSLATRLGRPSQMTASASIDSHLSFEALGSPAIPASPSMSDCLTDSPGSVSSINSFRRGDLADIEDLDLEPELETVSECDEESSSLCSLDIGADMDSDSERASSHGGDSDHTLVYGLGLSNHAARQALSRPVSSGSAASDYARRKRSEWLLNNYANKIAARRPRRTRKGRISEIVEEGGGEIKTTVMPQESNTSSTAEWACEISGPPMPPPRSISPSDTVPAVPSPLCSCVSVETTAAGLEESVETVRGQEETSPQKLKSEDSSTLSTNSSAVSTSELEHALNRVSRPSTRRNSSPPRLRPCFRRRGSQQSGCSTRESSCERDSPRGRSVRFSNGPPQEMRTHSPVEYDRKSYPVNHRLSPADVEELRTMKMEMGLLEARWAAVAACKPHKVEGTEGTIKPSNDNALNAGVAAVNAARQRPKAHGAESDSTIGPGAYSSPSSRMRQQKERDRQQERQLNLPHYLRDRSTVAQTGRTASNSAASEAMSVRSKFGHAPPPPLPGMPRPRSASSVSPSRPLGDTDSLSRDIATRSIYHGSRSGVKSLPQSPKRHISSADVPLLIETGPSPPTSPPAAESALDTAHQGIVASIQDAMENTHLSASKEVNDSHGRRSTCVTPSPSPWSSGPGSMTSSIYSSSYFPASQPSVTSHPSLGPGGSGYDSPASEFYESGSEYDLIC